jgi:hypothetical protein
MRCDPRQMLGHNGGAPSEDIIEGIEALYINSDPAERRTLSSESPYVHQFANPAWTRTFKRCPWIWEFLQERVYLAAEADYFWHYIHQVIEFGHVSGMRMPPAGNSVCNFLVSLFCWLSGTEEKNRITIRLSQPIVNEVTRILGEFFLEGLHRVLEEVIQAGINARE